MKFMNYIWIASFLMVFGFCSSETEENPKFQIDFKFESFGDFKSEIIRIVEIENERERDALLSEFLDTLKNRHQIPFVYGDSVAFLYKGNAITVDWAGDFNGWDPILRVIRAKK